jgi:enamine deaminase RidA (YjgF/YER057c/UK114 family)
MTLRLPGMPGYAPALRLLEEAGLGVEDIVHVVEYGSPAGGLPGGHEVPVSRVAVRPDLVELTAFPGGGDLVRDGSAVARVADGVVYLPTFLPRSGDGFRDQYRDCLEQAAELLEAAGAMFVQTMDYTAMATRAEYPRCGRPRRELLGGQGVFPGAAGILVDRLDPSVSLDAVGSTLPLTAVNPGWKRYETLTYQPGVLAGRTLFLSGFAALEPATQRAIFEGDLAAQAEFTYAGIAAVLREAGGAEVTRLVEYVVPEAAEAHQELVPLREKYFGDRVALTTVVCAALLRPEFLIEVVPTAVLR